MCVPPAETGKQKLEIKAEAVSASCFLPLQAFNKVHLNQIDLHYKVIVILAFLKFFVVLCKHTCTRTYQPPPPLTHTHLILPSQASSSPCASSTPV